MTCTRPPNWPSNLHLRSALKIDLLLGTHQKQFLQKCMHESDETGGKVLIAKLKKHFWPSSSPSHHRTKQCGGGGGGSSAVQAGRHIHWFPHKRNGWMLDWVQASALARCPGKEAGAHHIRPTDLSMTVMMHAHTLSTLFPFSIIVKYFRKWILYVFIICQRMVCECSVPACPCTAVWSIESPAHHYCRGSRITNKSMVINSSYRDPI